MATLDRRGFQVSATDPAVPTDPNPGVAIKAPVRIATTANIVLSGLQTIDGVTLLAGDRVLVKNQNAPVDNGIYVASTGSWTRAVDWNSTGQIVSGTIVPIGNEGTLNARALWQVATLGQLIIGTTAVALQFLLTAAGQIVLPVGSLSVPGLIFSGDATTGIYQTASGNFDIAAGGQRALTAQSSNVTVYKQLNLQSRTLSVTQSGLFAWQTQSGNTSNDNMPAGGFQVLNNTAASGDFSTYRQIWYALTNYDQSYNGGASLLGGNNLSGAIFWNPSSIPIGEDGTMAWYGGENFTRSGTHRLSQDRASISVTMSGGQVASASITSQPPYAYAANQTGIQVVFYGGTDSTKPYSGTVRCFASADGSGNLKAPSNWTVNADGTGGSPFPTTLSGGFSGTAGCLVQPPLPTPSGGQYSIGFDGGPTDVVARNVTGSGLTLIADVGTVVGPRQFALTDDVYSWVIFQDYGIVTRTSSSNSTATITIASPGVVSWTAHGFTTNQLVYFATTGALPTGLTASMLYYVTPLTANTFTVSSTLTGSAINTSGSQSGTHTAFKVTTTRGTWVLGTPWERQASVNDRLRIGFGLMGSTVAGSALDDPGPASTNMSRYVISDAVSQGVNGRGYLDYNAGYVRLLTVTAPMVLGPASTGVLYLSNTGTPKQALTLEKGNVVVATGLGIGTTDTDGYFYFPTMNTAGNPGGTPTSYNGASTGAAVVRGDAGNEKLWVRCAAGWKSTALT